MDDSKDALMAFLKEEGYAPQLGDAGAVQFKREGRVYLTFPDPNDSLYFNLYCLMNFGEAIPSREQGLTAANHVTRQVKAVKVTFPNLEELSAVSFGVEVLLPTPDSFRQVFERAISIIILSVEQFSVQIAPAQAAA